MGDDGYEKLSPGNGPSKSAPAEKPAARAESRDASSAANTGMLLSALLLVSLVVLPMTAFIVAEWNEANINTLRSNAELLAGMGCGTYDSGTGVYTLARGGIAFAGPARDDVQFLTGFESGCVTCPAVSGAVFDTATPAECTNIVDSGTGFAARRESNIACSAETTFSAAVETNEATANRVAVGSNSVHAPTNPWTLPAGRCDSAYWEDVPSGSNLDSALSSLDLRSVFSRARNMYFVSTYNGVGLCYCQSCGENAASSVNPAGATAACSSLYGFAASTSPVSTEMCNWAPTGLWGPSSLV